MYRCIYFMGIFFIALQAACAQQAFKVGEVIDQVPVQNSSETFSLYLPTKFDPDQLSAIVFIFDPSGNGNNGVRTFVESAEKFNYILVCSNATKNGIPYETNFASANKLFQTIFSTYRIDEKQIYAAGFSGGARLASSIATLTNKFQGVIACGAGMPINNKYNPKKNLFSFVGLVGDRDMNYQEMINTKQALDTLGVTNELLIYGDTHRWPPTAQIQRAFEWLEVRAYQKNVRRPNQNTINFLYQKQYRFADSLFRQKQYIRALSELKHVHLGFEHFMDTDSIQKRIIEIENSSAYKKAKSEYLQYLEVENRLYERYYNMYQREILVGVSKDNFSWWKKELKSLNERIAKTKIREEKNAYERVKFLFQGGLYQSSMSFVVSKDYQRALHCDQLSVLISPDNPYSHYRLAISYARNNDFSSMIKSLKRSKELNLRDFQRTQNTPEFSKYKGRKKFLKLYN